MTITSITAALVIGGVLGAAAALALGDRRRIPVWVLISVGVAAALAATVLARLAGLDASRLRLAELLVQIVAAAVALVVAGAPGWTGAADKHIRPHGRGHWVARRPQSGEQSNGSDGVTT
ncbi:hypothetical protein EV385_2989 [Krasilnikovia cinnamomea]|uniref:Uncharacterized protein n=1 Tax=Krasilnikovia cinnamomea TaxID=349313 RepID=A0A4Q7ZJV9_9ACTN|nr:GlsB/YeaQ/YmgE family stress response membrane protein [Krasilnikovia cinnamomea]RZU51187.1 hypothetical protein EV385_2989 [Krasilnikovia cinnamomea]